MDGFQRRTSLQDLDELIGAAAAPVAIDVRRPAVLDADVAVSAASNRATPGDVDRSPLAVTAGIEPSHG